MFDAKDMSTKIYKTLQNSLNCPQPFANVRLCKSFSKQLRSTMTEQKLGCWGQIIVNRLKYTVASRMVFLYISRQFHYLLCKNSAATPERNDGAPKKSILDGGGRWVDVRDKGDPTFVAGVPRQKQQHFLPPLQISIFSPGFDDRCSLLTLQNLLLRQRCVCGLGLSLSLSSMAFRTKVKEDTSTK